MTTEDLVQDYRRIVAGQVGVEFPTESEKTQPRRVWLLWRNDQVLGVLGSYDRAWEELHELMAFIGGVWSPLVASSHLTWCHRDSITEVRIEPREVVG